MANQTADERVPVPLRRRRIDIIFLIFFAINLGFITYLFDIEQVTVANPAHMLTYPAWPPKAIVDLVHWYGNHYDPLLMARPPFFRMTIWIDVIGFGPFYAFALYAFARGRDWIRVPALVWSGVMMANVLIILMEERVGTYATSHFRVVLGANAAWFLLPLAVIWRLYHDDPFTDDPVAADPGATDPGTGAAADPHAGRGESAAESGQALATPRSARHPAAHHLASVPLVPTPATGRATAPRGTAPRAERSADRTGGPTNDRVTGRSSVPGQDLRDPGLRDPDLRDPGLYGSGDTADSTRGGLDDHPADGYADREDDEFARSRSTERIRRSRDPEPDHERNERVHVDDITS